MAFIDPLANLQKYYNLAKDAKQNMTVILISANWRNTSNR